MMLPESASLTRHMRFGHSTATTDLVRYKIKLLQQISYLMCINCQKLIHMSATMPMFGPVVLKIVFFVLLKYFYIST